MQHVYQNIYLREYYHIIYNKIIPYIMTCSDLAYMKSILSGLLFGTEEYQPEVVIWTELARSEIRTEYTEVRSTNQLVF